MIYAILIFCTGTSSDRPARSDPVLFGLQFAADRGVKRSSRNPMTTLICKQEIHKYTNTSTIAKQTPVGRNYSALDPHSAA